MSNQNQYSKRDCIESIQKAAEELDKSPTQTEYKSLDIYPSVSSINRICGSWNEAKKQASLDCTYKYADSFSKEECIESLQEAAKILGKSPELKEYKSLDIYPKYKTFYDEFGSWNKAKEAAGLEIYTTGRSYSKKPSILTMSEKEWKNITPDRRYLLKRRTRLHRIKLAAGCNRCNFNEHPSALEFHHTDPKLKGFEITPGFLSGSHSWKETKREIKKCEILCSNCHRIEESNLSYQ